MKSKTKIFRERLWIFGAMLAVIAGIDLGYYVVPFLIWVSLMLSVAVELIVKILEKEGKGADK